MYIRERGGWQGGRHVGKSMGSWRSLCQDWQDEWVYKTRKSGNLAKVTGIASCRGGTKSGDQASSHCTFQQGRNSTNSPRDWLRARPRLSSTAAPSTEWAVIPLMHELAENMRQDVYIECPFPHKELVVCLAHTLFHFNTGFLTVTFQPSLNTVGEDPSRSPPVPS